MSARRESAKAAKLRIREVAARLAARYPDAECALQYQNDPWRLLVMGRLSAQCTDARVNLVAGPLFERYPTPAAMAEADPAELEALVRSCGLFRTKAKEIREASAMLCREYGGVLPDSMEALLRLPGVGRKIANLLLGDIYGRPAVVADTHCIRITARLGFCPPDNRDPLKTERLLTPLLEGLDSSAFCHRIVLFGREICAARAPACATCPLSDLCPHFAKAGEKKGEALTDG